MANISGVVSVVVATTAACCLPSHAALGDGPGTLRIGGSWTGYPAHVRLAEQFTHYRKVPTDVQGRNNARGFEYLRDGELDVVIYSPVYGVPLRDAVRNVFPDENAQPNEYHFGRFAVLVVVHRGNSVRRLTIEQLHAVFSGKATQWHDLAGTPRPIVRVGERHTAKSWEIMQQAVMRGGPVAIERLDFKSSREVVAHVAKHPGAIGFCLDRREPLDGVRALRIARDHACPGVGPSPQNILSGDYPLIEDVLLFTRPDGPELADEYCRFACGPDASEIVVNSYYYSSFEREQFLVNARVKEMHAGKGAPITAIGPAAAAALVHELVTDFVRAKELVQLQYEPAVPGVPHAAGGSVEGPAQRLQTGAAELLVVDGRLEEPMHGRVMEMGGAEGVLGNRAVGVVVHAQNPQGELTVDDLRQILSGEVDRWPGLSGTAERIILHGLPPASPLMRMVDDVLGLERKRATMTRRPDTGRVILSVAAQPGALGLVDLTEFPRHETKVKLVAIVPAGAEAREGDSPNFAAATGERSGTLPPVPRNLGQSPGYPLAQPVTLYVSGKASDAGRAFFEFLAEGNARDALLAHGVVPRPAAPREKARQAEAMAAAPQDFRDVVLGDFPEKPEEAEAEGAPEPEEEAAERDLLRDDPFQLPETAAAEPEEDMLKRELQQEEARAAGPPPIAPGTPPTEGGLEAWVADNMVLLVLIGLGVLAIAVTLGSATMKRNRRRNDLLRKYRP